MAVAAAAAAAEAVVGRAHSEPELRKRAEVWFASLAVGERSRLLTFEDPAWCLLAANMAARLDRRAFAGQEVRFEVQPPPASGGGGGGGSGGCGARYGRVVNDVPVVRRSGGCVGVTVCDEFCGVAFCGGVAEWPRGGIAGY